MSKKNCLIAEFCRSFKFFHSFKNSRSGNNLTDLSNVSARLKRKYEETSRHFRLARKPFHVDNMLGVVNDRESQHYKRFIIPDKQSACNNCNAILLHGESRNFCCFNGKVSLSPLRQNPEFLHNLLNRTAQESSIFFANIRAFNSSLAFASLGADVNESLAKSTKGVYTFQAHGAVYHNIGPIQVKDGERPKFAQIYVYDGNETNREQSQLESRIQHNSQLNTNICRSILLGEFPNTKKLNQSLRTKGKFNLKACNK